MIAAVSLQFVVAAILEIFIIYLVIYGTLRFLQGTHGAGILRGLVFFVILAILFMLVGVKMLSLYRIESLLGFPVLGVLIAILVLFQPEFRRVLTRFGEAPLFRWFFKATSPMMEEIVRAALELSKQKFGGLIVIEGEVGLGAFIEGGVRINAEVKSDLLVNIFWPGAPLHDGGVVVRGDRVAAAGCLFPLTENPEVGRNVGTRHRAAIGVTEISDAVAVIVSEETQEVSVAYRGRLMKNLDRAKLQRAFAEIAAESRRGGPEEGEKTP